MPTALTTPSIAPEDVHPNFSPETLQAIRRARADTGPTRPTDEVFADLGIDLASIRNSSRRPRTDQPSSVPGCNEQEARDAGEPWAPDVRGPKGALPGGVDGEVEVQLGADKSAKASVG